MYKALATTLSIGHHDADTAGDGKAACKIYRSASQSIKNIQADTSLN
jgi:hypothetical protein